MMFFKLAYFDIKNSFNLEWKKFLVVPIGFLTVCFPFYLRYAKIGAVGFGDFWLYMFGGIKEYTYDDAFKFPVIWTVVLLYLFYITLYYPYNDLLGYGQNVLIRSGSRFNWWLSKCLWNAFAVVTFFTLGAASVALFCVFTGGPLSTEISPLMYTEVFEMAADIVYPSYTVGTLIGMPLLTAVAISQLQMLLSLWLRPIFSFGVTAAILILSAYYLKTFMVGNYAMPIRSVEVIPNGVSPQNGVIILSAIIIACIVIGGIAFKYYDIINKEN